MKIGGASMFDINVTDSKLIFNEENAWIIDYTIDSS